MKGLSSGSMPFAKRVGTSARPPRRSLAKCLGNTGGAAILVGTLWLTLAGFASDTDRVEDTAPNKANRPSPAGASTPAQSANLPGAMLVANPGMANDAEERDATFFMGRIRYSNNDGNDCSRVGENLVKLVAQVSTIQVQRERIVAFNDPRLFATPFLFMNGHNDFQLRDAELSNLRNYFQRGGFLLASGCCTNPGFPQACRRELSRILPGEKVRRLAYDHPIYRSFYKLSRIRCLHEPRDIYLEGLFDRGRLVAVMCEDGLCCAFSMDNRCNVNKGVSPDDGRKLALNIAVYSLTH